jgi:hypothetical protein
MGLVLAIWSTVAVAADPLTLILLRLLRDQIITAAAQAAYESAQQAPKPPAGPIVFPPHPYDLDEQKLRTLIDEGFVHLTAAQRDEVFTSVKRILADPKNSAIRLHIIEELALKASAVRQAHEQLDNLSDSRKRAIVSEAREAYEALPAEERQEMIAVLQSGVVPIPRDLNEMMLAEFRGVPAPPPQTPASTQTPAPTQPPAPTSDPVVTR